jgi:predicted RNase H-like nuclease (RuvC/YqgF family)
MENLSEIIEQELENAFEVKDKNSLHRFVLLFTDNIINKTQYIKDTNDIVSSLKEGFNLMEKRFIQVDKRFEMMEKRFEMMEKHFEAVDKRFEDLYKHIDKRFEAVDKRFEAVDKRFEDMNSKFVMMFRFMSIGFAIITFLIVLFKFL